MNTHLPKGLRIDHGYVQIRITFKGHLYCKNFGVDTPFAREIAAIHLAEKRKEILMGKFGIEKEIPRKKFKEAAYIYLDLWSKEIKPEGGLKHTTSSIYGTKLFIDKSIIPWFNHFYIDEIKHKDVESWRIDRLRRVSGTSANREQGVLSSLFSHIERWIKTEKIKPFKIPQENPCANVEKAKVKKRMRVLTPYEAKKLKFAFIQLRDIDGWGVCKLALKSVLSLKDLKHLEIGSIIDIERAKTGVPVQLPITILSSLNFINWRKRWESARKEAGLDDVQFRDLRKTGINWLKGRHDLKLISEFAGHADIETTENFYTVENAEKLKPLAFDLDNLVENL